MNKSIISFVSKLAIVISVLTVVLVSAVCVQAQTQTSSAKFCYNWTENLTVGSHGSDVRALNQALLMQNISGSTSLEGQQQTFISDDGVFTERTSSAVVGFQEKYTSEILTPNDLVRGTGYVGPATRAKLNKLYGCPNRKAAPTVTPTPTPSTSPKYDESIKNGSITLISPVGSENWSFGNKYNVTWRATGYTGNVYIYLNFPNGKQCYKGSNKASVGYVVVDLTDANCSNYLNGPYLVPGTYTIGLYADGWTINKNLSKTSSSFTISGNPPAVRNNSITIIPGMIAPVGTDLSASLLDSHEDKAGVWNNFSDGPGSNVFTRDDWNWTMTLTVPNNVVVNSVSIRNPSMSEAWSTSVADIYGKPPYPLVVIDENGVQLNTKYGQTFSAKSGTHTYRLYGQKESSYTNNVLLTVGLGDGSSISTNVSMDSKIIKKQQCSADYYWNGSACVYVSPTSTPTPTPSISPTYNQPTCVLSSNKSTYTVGENITYSWTSQNATYAWWKQDTSGKEQLKLPGDKLTANGSQKVTASVVGNPTATLMVAGNGSPGYCSKTVSVVTTSTNKPITISVLTPINAKNGTTSFIPGDTLNMSWTSNTVGIKKIVLASYEGTIVPVFENAVGSLPYQSLNYSWNVPTTLATGYYKVRVYATDGVTYADSSYFRVSNEKVPQYTPNTKPGDYDPQSPELSVLTPTNTYSGYTSFRPGDTMNIKWSLNTTQEVKRIRLVPANGGADIDVLDRTNLSYAPTVFNSYSWVVPKTVPYAKYYVYVQVGQDSTTSSYAYSKGLITVINPEVTPTATPTPTAYPSPTSSPTSSRN